jgi:hypothetical protein
MIADFEKQKFNDDLLLNESDVALATRRYPTIVHVLDHPELRNYFERFEAPANGAKRSGRAAGFIAIALACFALMVASSEQAIPHDARVLPTLIVDHLPAMIGKPLSHITVSSSLAIVAALAGISSAMIGSLGILFAGKKREWLHNRFMTETIRQFHFQTFIARLPDILASLNSDEAKETFRLHRERWLETLKARFDGKLSAEFGSVINDDSDADFWLHDQQRELDVIGAEQDLVPLFRAYRELRIMHQIGYASYQLRDDHKLFSSAPRRQAALLSGIGLICIILLCAIHVGLLIGVIARDTFWFGFRSEIASVVVIWIAIVALGLRALEEGLQPEREIERYQQYYLALRAIVERFDHAHLLSERLATMRAMERLAFDEMRNFFLTNNRARFAM